MPKKLMVYIAGPYSHPDPVENTHRAIKVAEDLIARGFLPIIPHQSMLWQLVSPHPIRFWYDYDLDILERCDILYRIPGESKGADAEVKYAKDKGIPVCETIEQLLNFQV